MAELPPASRSAPTPRPPQRVGLAGLGSIGMAVARALDGGIEGLTLALIASGSDARAEQACRGFRSAPRAVSPEELAEADIVVEAAPAAVFARIAEPAIAAGRIFVPCSVGALLNRRDLVETARRTGARIIVPTGALLGLDAVRAIAEGQIDAVSVTLETRKPPLGLEGAPHITKNGIVLSGLREAVCVFDGNALEAAIGFPANMNVAAALALAGIGAERTRVRVWADPAVSRNTHVIRVEAPAARFTMSIEGVPSLDNPKTGQLTPMSVIACLRGLTATLRVGS